MKPSKVSDLKILQSKWTNRRKKVTGVDLGALSFLLASKFATCPSSLCKPSRQTICQGKNKLATKENTQLPGLLGIGEVNQVVPVFIADYSFLAHISSFFFAKTWVGH